MKKMKTLLFAILASGLLALTSCDKLNALFNDDDLSLHNSFNDVVSIPKSEEPQFGPRAGGVYAREIEETPNAYCFKKIPYYNNGEDSIINTYKEGGVNHVEYNVNAGEDFSAERNKNNFDLYVPKDLDKTAKQTVVLFIHGGAWISGFKTDVNPYVFEFANRGYISATIQYTLLKRTMDDASLSVFRDLDEIDACISSIKSALADLEFDTSKISLVIGGASSGAHLTMLYAYSRGHRSALPIKFLIDAVGPVDMKPDNWKSFRVTGEADLETALDAGLSNSVIEQRRTDGKLKDLRVADPDGDPYYWNEYETMRIANGMCGIPYTPIEIQNSTDENKESIVNPNEASNSMTKVGGGEDQVSVTYWMNQTTNSYPMVCAYAGKDTIVGIAQFAKLQAAMDVKGIDYDYVYFRNSGHTQISKENDETKYNEFVNKVLTRLESI